MAISIVGLNKADVLAALYNASRPQGMGFMQYKPEPMSRREAEENLARGRYFDYLNGRVMKVDLSSDTELNAGLYDRDNGQGAAQRVIDALRADAGAVNAPEIRAAHVVGKMAAAEKARAALSTESTFDSGIATLGMADVADVLAPAIDRAESPSFDGFGSGDSGGGGASSDW